MNNIHTKHKLTDLQNLSVYTINNSTTVYFYLGYDKYFFIISYSSQSSKCEQK